MSLDWEPNSASPPLGDSATTINPATLTGGTEPGLSVELLPGGQQATADGAGQFVFNHVPLTGGTNQVDVRPLDLAYNEALL